MPRVQTERRSAKLLTALNEIGKNDVTCPRIAGEAILLHHQHRELDVQPEDVVPGEKLHE